MGKRLGQVRLRVVVTFTHSLSAMSLLFFLRTGYYSAGLFERSRRPIEMRDNRLFVKGNVY